MSTEANTYSAPAVPSRGGRSLDSNGVDFTLIEPTSNTLLVREYVYTVTVGHVVLQALTWHPEPEHEGKIIRIKAAPGPWEDRTFQIWPISKKTLMWPPRLSLSTVIGVTHYGNVRLRFKNSTGHELITLKKNSPGTSLSSPEN